MERYVSALAPALAARGTRVTVIGGAPEHMRPPLSAAGIDFVPAATMSQAMRALAAVQSADVVNTHMTEADVVAAVPGLARRARLVSTRHFAARRGSRPQLRPVFAWVGRRFSAQIAISHFVADAIEGASVVVHTGVADAVASMPGDRERTVLVAQRLEREKDTATAIRAWSRTTAAADGWRLIVAGDGAERGDLERLAQDLGVAGTVDFVGHLADVGDAMSRAGLLLAPTPREGLGLSVLEAMARGLPVVASASGGHLETAGEVAPERLFEPGNDIAAAAIIDALVADDEGRAEYGAALRARQRERFSVDAQVERTVGLYEEVLAR